MAGPRLQATIDLQDRLSGKLKQASDNLVKFSKKVNITAQALKGLRSAADGVVGPLLKVGGKAVSTGVSFTTAKLAAMRSAVTAIGVAAVRSNTDFESMAVTMKTLYGGDVLKASQAYDWMQKFAVTTPYGQAEVMSSMSQMMSSDMDYTKYLQAAGNLASAKGVALKETTRAFTRIATGDFGEAFKQLREFGIDHDVLQAEGLQFSSDNEYLGGRDEALNALYNIIQSRYEGQMERQSQTVKGMVSNIEESWSMLTQSLMGWDKKTLDYRPGSIYARFRDGLKAIQGMMDAIRDKWIEMDSQGATFTKKIEAAWKMVASKIKDWFEREGRETVASWAKAAGSGLSGMIMAVFTGSIDSMWAEIGNTAASSFVKGFKQNFDMDQVVSSDLGQTLGKGLALGAALKFGPSFVTGLLSLSELLGGLLGGSTAAAASGAGASGAAASGAAVGGASAGLIGGGILAAVAAAAYLVMQPHLLKNAKTEEQSDRIARQGAGGVVGGVAGGVVGFLLGGPFGAAIGAAIGIAIGEAFVRLWEGGFIQKAVAAIPGLVNQLVNWLMQGLGYLVGMALNLLGWLVGAIFGAIAAPFIEIANFITRLFTDPMGLIRDLWDGILGIIKTIGGWFSSLWEGFASAASKFGKFFSWGFDATAGGSIQQIEESAAKMHAKQYHGGGLVDDEGWAILKRKEMVLDPNLSSFIRDSASQARGRGQSGSGQVVVQIGSLANTLEVREEADVHKVATALTAELRKVFANQGQYAVAGVAM